jgi:ArsR family transcriptional regulator
MDINNALSAFAALSQQTRLEVFRLLIRAGHRGMLSGELGEALGIKSNTMSGHLTVLLHAGLVTNQRSGRQIRYFADFVALKNLMTFLMEDCCGASPDLCQPLLDEITCPC